VKASRSLVSVILAVLLAASCALAQAEKYYLASSQREPFHRPSCTWAAKITEDHLQVFKTREAAIAAGHRPCKVCKP